MYHHFLKPHQASCIISWLISYMVCISEASIGSRRQASSISTKNLKKKNTLKDNLQLASDLFPRNICKHVKISIKFSFLIMIPYTVPAVRVHVPFLLSFIQTMILCFVLLKNGPTDGQINITRKKINKIVSYLPMWQLVNSPFTYPYQT